MQFIGSLRDKSSGWADFVVIVLALGVCAWAVGEARRVEEPICDVWGEKGEERTACLQRHGIDQ